MHSGSWSVQQVLELRAEQPQPSGELSSLGRVPTYLRFKGLLTVAFVLIVAASWVSLFSAGNGDIRTEKDPLARGLQLPMQQPATTSPRQPSILRPSLVVLAWMMCSTGFILYNKWMFTTGGFPYPVTLTAMQHRVYPLQQMDVYNRRLSLSRNSD